MKALMKILFCVNLLNVVCFAREISNLSKEQIETKYKDRLEQKTSMICPEKKAMFSLSKVPGVSSLSSQREAKREQLLSSRTVRSFSDKTTQETERMAIGTDSIIEIGGTITGTLRLQSKQEYHATSDVIVDGGYLIHEPGAVVRWTQDTGLYVRNHGTYISKGLPWALCANMADVNNAPVNYWKGILIEESASSNCEIRFSVIWDANTGIELHNQTLNRFITYNSIGYCITGIKAYGPKHTKITNNFCYLNYTGIQCFYKGYDGHADPNESVVDIEQNTCLWNTAEGIRVHMIDDYTPVSPVILNNISAGNWWNYSFEEGACLANLVLCNGSWLDPDRLGSTHIWYFDPNDWGIIIEDSPSSPFTGFYSDAIFLDQGCVFIDAGVQNILNTTYMGTTTNLDGTPDSNKIDLGFHYSNWDYSNAGSTTLKADIDNSLAVDIVDISVLVEYWLFDYDEAYEVYVRDGDGSGVVDFGDLQIIADNWLAPFDFTTFAWFAQKWQEEVDPRIYGTIPDIFPDGRIDFKDFSVLANEWQQTCDANPNIQINASLDTDSGYAEVGISDYRQDTAHILLFVNGFFEDDMFGFRKGRTSKINLAEFGGGYCEFKVVSFNDDGRITCSNLETLDFNSPMEYMRCPEVYYANELDHFCVFSDEPNDICVRALDIGQNVVWTMTYPSDGASGFIPASITSTYEIECVEFEMVTPTPGGMMMLMGVESTGLPSTVKIIKTKGFKPKDVPSNTDSLIILPDNWIDYFVNKHVTDVVRETFDHEFELKGGEAISTNIAWFAQNRNIKYIYYSGHGNYEFGGKLRTGIKLSDGVGFSVRVSDYSDPNQAPFWCKAMGGGYENGDNMSFAQMGFTSLKYVYFDCCFTGRLKIDGRGNLIEGSPGSQGILDCPDSDMSWALGNPAYQGWYDECPHGKRSTFSKFSKDEWEKLRDGNTLYQALLYAISKSDIDPQFSEDPAEHFRLKERQDIFSLKVD